jgi:tetratricopeptide (TPR) repeat protein
VRPFALLLPFLLALAPRPQEPDPEALWQAGRRVEALQAMQASLERTPRDDALRRELAGRQLTVHWYEAALETLAPLGGEVERQRGLALYRLGRWEQALEHLPANDPASALMRLETLEALGRLDEAEALLGPARDLLGPDDPRLLDFEGRSLARRDRHAEAVSAFRRALDLDPVDGAALHGLGRSLIALGERQEGLAVLERQRRLTPLLDQLDFAQRSVDLAPLHAPNLAALGDAERALGRSERALQLYQRAQELAQGEDVVPIALRLARALAEDSHDPDAAVLTLERAAARVPDARLYVRAGDVLMAAQRPLEAVQRFLKAQELRPTDPAIAGRIEQARAAYKRDPDR